VRQFLRGWAFQYCRRIWLMENAGTVGKQLPVFFQKANLDSVIKKLYGHFRGSYIRKILPCE